MHSSFFLSSVLLSVVCHQQSENIKRKNSRDRQFVCFKFCAIMSSLLKSLMFTLCPTESTPLNFPVAAHPLSLSHLVIHRLSHWLSQQHSVCVHINSLYFTMVPKHMTCEANNSIQGMPKRSHECFF